MCPHFCVLSVTLSLPRWSGSALQVCALADLTELAELPNGECNYTNENCWFNHKENEMINENENNENEIEGNREVIQKIFEMMENFTKEITQLKEINNLQ